MLLCVVSAGSCMLHVVAYLCSVSMCVFVLVCVSVSSCFVYRNSLSFGE